jgi:hypothetical protein
MILARCDPPGVAVAVVLLTWPSLCSFSFLFVSTFVVLFIFTSSSSVFVSWLEFVLVLVGKYPLLPALGLEEGVVVLLGVDERLGRGTIMFFTFQSMAWILARVQRFVVKVRGLC